MVLGIVITTHYKLSIVVNKKPGPTILVYKRFTFVCKANLNVLIVKGRSTAEVQQIRSPLEYTA